LEEKQKEIICCTERRVAHSPLIFFITFPIMAALCDPFYHSYLSTTCIHFPLFPSLKTTVKSCILHQHSLVWPKISLWLNLPLSSWLMLSSRTYWIATTPVLFYTGCQNLEIFLRDSSKNSAIIYSNSCDFLSSVKHKKIF